VLSIWAWSPDALWAITQKVWWFLIVLGVLVSFHELGHFLAARWVGVRVLKFSLGFGPKLAGRQIGETEYLVSAVPLGGYVKLFGEEETEVLTQDEQRRSFAHQTLPRKMFIVAAGPGFNFLLAYLVFAGWLSTGAPLFVPTFRDLTPNVEALKPGSPAELAGMKVGDRIIRVDEKDISTRNEVQDAVQKSNGRPLTMDVQRGDQIKTLIVTPSATAIKEGGKEVVTYHIGIEETPPVITAVMSGSPAMAAGFRDGDRVVSIEGQPIQAWSQMTGFVKENPNRPLRVQVQRDGQLVTLTVTPMAEKTLVDGKQVEVGKIGISGPGRSIIRASNPFMAGLLGMQATWGWTELTAVGLYKMVAGEISSKNIGGPLTIANMSGEAASQGVASIVFLIAILSINLGVLNLLPIPILDGGHLLFFGIEAILRKPLGERQREIAQQVGLLLLVGIMVFAFWNDIERLISH
jgi:regulator of sigma E protease